MEKTVNGIGKIVQTGKYSQNFHFEKKKRIQNGKNG